MQRIDPVESGKRLKELRGIRTKTGVAEAVGVTSAAISAYENGERTPRDEIKCRLANYYGVSVQSIWYPRAGKA